MALVPSQLSKEVIATVTAVEMIDASLYGVRIRLKDGTVAIIVIPKGLVTVEDVLLTTQAVMQITAIMEPAT